VVRKAIPEFSTTELDVCKSGLTISLHRWDAEALKGLPGGNTPGEVWGIWWYPVNDVVKYKSCKGDTVSGHCPHVLPRERGGGVHGAMWNEVKHQKSSPNPESDSIREPRASTFF